MFIALIGKPRYRNTKRALASVIDYGEIIACQNEQKAQRARSYIADVVL
jgi:hypothetical protein